MNKRDATSPARRGGGWWRAACTAATFVCGLAVGCHTDAARTTSPDAAAADEASNDGAEQESTAQRQPVAGVAHTANIDKLALCPDGTCAVTRDGGGALRYWTSLDGSAEPQPIPTRGAAEFSIARVSEDAVTVAVVEASGGVKIFSGQADATLQEQAELSPFDPVLQAHVLPGGKRILVLRKDRSLRLHDTKGAELASFDERRFRPDRLLVSDDGSTVIAIVHKKERPNDFKVELVPLRVTTGGDKVEIGRAGSPRLAESTAAFEVSSTSLSADGRRFAFTDRATPGSGPWTIRVIDLENPDADVSFEALTPPHILPQLGFTGDERLFVSSSDGTVSWLHDLKTDKRWPRAANPQDFNHQGRVSAVRAGVQAMGYGSWLYVHEFERKDFRYLGYDVAVGQTVAVSPSGTHVAWGFNQGPVVIEAVDGSEAPTRLRFTDMMNVSAWRVRFIDDEHLIVVDTVGNILLVKWRSGETIDATGVNGPVRDVGYLPESELLLVHRHTGDARVFTASASEGFKGPWLVADNAFRMGLLRPRPPSTDVLWTIDSGNKLRIYTLDELQSELDHAAADAKGKQLASGQPAPMAIDALGRKWGVRWADGQMEVFVDEGERLTTTQAPGTDVNLLVPSQTGGSVALVSGRGAAIALSVHDGKTLDQKWSYALGGFQTEVVWSPDGQRLGVVGNAGAVLLDGETGEPVVTRCGLAFEVVQAPPPTAFSSSGQRSLCEP